MRALALLLLCTTALAGEARVYKAKKARLERLCGSQHTACRPAHVAGKRLPFGFKYRLRSVEGAPPVDGKSGAEEDAVGSVREGGAP